MKAVVCRVGNEEFALDIGNVISIERMERVTPLPETPHYVIGMIEYRDKIITIVDLRSWLNKQSEAKEQQERIITVEYSDKIIGVIVDSATEIIDYQEEKLQEVKQISTDKAKKIINLEKENRIILVLDLSTLFSNLSY